MIMNYNISYVSGHSCQRWDDFLHKTDNSHAFQQYGWRDIIEEVYGHKPYYLLAEDESGEISGIMPLFLVTGFLFKKNLISVPYAPHGGMCYRDETVRDLLFHETLSLVDKLNVDNIEIRCVDNNADIFDNVNSPLSMFTNYSTFVLDLSKGIDHIWTLIGKNTKNRARKGENIGLTYEINPCNNNSIDKFYEIFAVDMKRLGTPVHKKDFFKAISHTFKNDVYISNVKFNGDIICSQLLLAYKDVLISGWSASLAEFRKFSPNNFMDWNNMKYGCMQGYKWLDLGRSPVNSGNYDYKRRWGGDEIPLSYYYLEKKGYISNQSKYSQLSKYWSKIPLPITKIIGPLIRGKIV